MNKIIDWLPWLAIVPVAFSVYLIILLLHYRFGKRKLTQETLETWGKADEEQKPMSRESHSHFSRDER